MFHMMNEARIGVGTAATMLGLAGYYASLDYAKNRPQGRPDGRRLARTPATAGAPSSNTPTSSACCWRKRAYCEGALALELYCARLVDEHSTRRGRGRRGPPAAGGADPHCQELAQRVVPGGQFAGHPDPRRLWLHARLSGGAVLARQPPEHDPRRHPRHSGHGPAGPQGADGRGRGLHCWPARINATIEAACSSRRLAAHANASGRRLQQVGAATKAAWATGEPTDALANAVPYMQAFGHMVLAWIWLDVAAGCTGRCAPFATSSLAISRWKGKSGCMRFFYHYELPKIGAWLKVVETRDATCATLAGGRF
jgi:hypothetical protein